jgi:hypothetical protein
VALVGLDGSIDWSAMIVSRREENTRIISPEIPLISNPCPSSRAVHSRPNRVVRASSRCRETIRRPRQCD